MNLSEYLSGERGRASRVAERSGVSAAFLPQIASGVRPCPAERGAEIERACELKVRRWDLRPDDWHRIWPELIGADGAPAVPSASPTRHAALPNAA